MIFNMSGSGDISIKAITVNNESNLPASARDGVIAVVSSVKAKTVYVQNTEPLEFVEGDIWMTVAEDSNAPIQKKAITVYPSSFKQRIGTSWITVPGYVRYNGVWESLDLWLFKTGNPYSNITGGWKKYGTNEGAQVNEVDNITSGQSIVFTMPKMESGGYAHATVGTTNLIPAGKYNRLVVSGYKTYVSAIDVGFAQSISEWNPSYDVFINCVSMGSSEETFELDISSLGSDYQGYLFIRATTTSNAKDTDTITITEVYLCN